MLTEEYIERISHDWLWREKELREVDARLLERQNTFELKSGILLVYSHWEGHFKFSATELLKFISEGINRKIFKWTDVKSDVRFRILFCSFRKSNISGQTQETFMYYLNALSDARYADALKAKDEIVMIDDNLSSSRAEAICRNLGIDYSWCALKKTIIDERILEYRNAIAHGAQRLRSGDEVDLLNPDIFDAIGDARNLIRETKNRFQNAIEGREFLTK
jgi:hypothetical protein